MLPRSDVGAGGLQGALAYLLMIVLDNDGIFDFATTEAAVVAVIAFCGGYIAPKFKPLYTALSGALAAIVTSGIGYLFFDVPFDKGMTSTLIAACAVALATYRTPPYSASQLDPGYVAETPGNRRVSPSGPTTRR